MKSLAVCLWALLCCVVLLSTPSLVDPAAGTPKPWEGRVVGIVTADTLKVQRYGYGALLVGLAGVAAPPPNYSCLPLARSYLSALAGVGDFIEVHPLGVTDHRDRTVAWVYVVSQIPINLSQALLRAGLGIVDISTCADMCRPLLDAQKQAQEARRGCWREPSGK